MKDIPNSYLDNFTHNPDAHETLRKICSLAPSELTSLHSEIAVAKLTAQDAIKLYSATDKIEDLKERILAKNNAYEFVHRVFSQLQKLCEAASRIDSNNKTSSAVGLARAIIEEATLVAEEMFSLPPQQCDKFRNSLLESFEIQDSPSYSGPTGPGMLDQQEMSQMMTILSSPPSSNGRH